MAEREPAGEAGLEARLAALEACWAEAQTALLGHRKLIEAWDRRLKALERALAWAMAHFIATGDRDGATRLNEKFKNGLGI